MGAAESRSGDMVSAQTPPTASRSVTKRVVQRAEEPAGLAIQRRAAISPRPFAATDTVLGLATLQPMAEREEQFLTDDSGDLPLAEQGARWRVLGEVREWLARTLHSRDEAESAMHAYVRASAADPRHRGADAARLARVRQLLSSLSAE